MFSILEKNFIPVSQGTQPFTASSSLNAFERKKKRPIYCYAHNHLYFCYVS